MFNIKFIVTILTRMSRVLPFRVGYIKCANVKVVQETCKLLCIIVDIVLVFLIHKSMLRSELFEIIVQNI
jgi:hypothetical protein